MSQQDLVDAAEATAGRLTYCKETHQKELKKPVPSLRLKAKPPGNGWLEDEFSYGVRPIFRDHVSFWECNS